MADARISHPTFRRLLDVADGLRVDPRARAADEHVTAGCARCSDELLEIVGLRDALAAGPLPTPPRPVVRRARALFATRRLRAGAAAVTRVLAALVLDGRMAAAPALRSGGDGRRLLWTVGDVEVFATLVDGRSGATLRGQVLPAADDDGAAEGSIRLLRDGRVAQRSVLDDDGEFVAGGLRPGTYVIEGDVGDLAFRTPPFVVGA